MKLLMENCLLPGHPTGNTKRHVPELAPLLTLGHKRLGYEKPYKLPVSFFLMQIMSFLMWSGLAKNVWLCC
jgi:hypothetical protein